MAIDRPSYTIYTLHRAIGNIRILCCVREKIDAAMDKLLDWISLRILKWKWSWCVCVAGKLYITCQLSMQNICGIDVLLIIKLYRTKYIYICGRVTIHSMYIYICGAFLWIHI